jgi:hypothetical protein
MIKKLNIDIDSVKPPDWLGYKSTWKDKVGWFIRYEIINRFIPYKVRDFYWMKVKTIWAPKHSRIRKAVPRHWIDLDHVLQDVNFEIIKSFYEDEYKDGIVDWEGTGGEATEFVKWLEEAYTYITVYRKVLEKQIDNAYPNYKKVEKLEKEMEDKDTKVLTELVKWRRHMWT